ncbi:MAG: replication initiation factor domain-containing protein [Verrucomicrobia bacterium]|nr:replication initiation factor domain-containing protein [Verrucomicrobiota bacterium]
MNDSSIIQDVIPSGAGRCPPLMAGAAAPGGVMSSNTPPLSSHWVGAEDWLECSMYVDWLPEKWVETRDKLEIYKELAAHEEVPKEFKRWDVNGIEVNVEPAGAKLGHKNKGSYFAYKMEYGEITVLIADHPSPRGSIPNVVIRINGEACLIYGAINCLKHGRDFIACLGGIIRKEKLSRVDIALDMPGVGMSDFFAAFNEKRYICRAKSRGFTESNGLTLKFGESPLLLRIYDKLAETQKRANPLKAFAIKDRRWDGVIPGQAARVEFELKREALKERGIDSPDDYFMKRADLVNYLVRGWFRFTSEVVDRENKNQSRAEVLPLWKEVQTAFESWAGSPAGCSLAPLNREAVDVTQLFKQMLGLGKAAARYQGKNNLNTEELLPYIMNGLRANA